MIYDGDRLKDVYGKSEMIKKEEFKNPVFYTEDNRYCIVLARYEPPKKDKTNKGVTFGVLTIAVFKYNEEDRCHYFDRFIRFGHAKNTSKDLNQSYYSCTRDFNYDICFDYNPTLLIKDSINILRGKRGFTEEDHDYIKEQFYKLSQKKFIEKSFCLYLTNKNLDRFNNNIKDIPNSQWNWYIYENMYRNYCEDLDFYENNGYSFHRWKTLMFDEDNKDLELIYPIHELIRYHFPPLKCVLNTVYEEVKKNYVYFVRNYNKPIYEPILDEELDKKPVIKGI